MLEIWPSNKIRALEICERLATIKDLFAKAIMTSKENGTGITYNIADQKGLVLELWTKKSKLPL